MNKLFILVCLVAVGLGATLPKLGGRKLHHPRIIRGTRVEIEDAPYMVQVEVNRTYLAGGVIVNKHHVITAARPIYKLDKSTLGVRVGTGYVTSGGVVHSVAEVTIPKNFTGGYSYNIAVLKLDSAMEFNNATKKVKFAEEEPEHGKMGTIYGYGSVDGFFWVQEPWLTAADIRAIERYLCGGLASSTEICGGDELYSTCYGDEGGPYVVNDLLVGITSNATGCGEKGTSTYTSIPVMRSWIDESI